MKDFKRLGLPLLIIIASAIIVRFVNLYVVADFADNLVTIIIVVSLFLFGTTLNIRKTSNAIMKKVIAIALLIVLMLMQMNIFTITFIKDFFDLFGIGSFFVNMIYIYCGYLFVD